MNINEACFHLADGKTMNVEDKKIRLYGGYFQCYSEEEGKWLFTEQNEISKFYKSDWTIA